MSFSPSLSLVRLQELKLWQGSYENMIQKSKLNSQHSQYSDFEHVEGVSVLNDSNASDSFVEGGKTSPKDWDKRTILPTKPFEQLLEEKLKEDTPMEGEIKPKKPFLRKGQGLARFRMGAGPPINNKTKNTSTKKFLETPKYAPPPLQKSPPSKMKGILKKTNPYFHQDIDLLTPLTVPDFVKPRGTWKSVFESCENSFRRQKSSQQNGGFMGNRDERVENYEEFRRSLGRGEARIIRKEKQIDDSDSGSERDHITSPNSRKRCDSDSENSDIEVSLKPRRLTKPILENYNEQIVEKISQFAKKYFHSSKTYVSNSIPGSISDVSTPKLKSGAGDLTQYEEKMARELKAFEELEKKVENSSFCSTNTSVANLLASTPQKVSGSDDKNNSRSLALSDNVEFTSDRHENIQLQLEEVAAKTNILQQFLSKLRKMEDKCIQDENFTIDSDVTKKSTSTNTSFSEENTRWSTRSPSLTDNCTEFDTTFQSVTSKMIDAGVNTSFDCSGLDQTVKNTEPCKECEELRNRLSETKKKILTLQSKNSKLNSEKRDLECEYEQSRKEIRQNKENYLEKMEELQEELDNERKKVAKERSYFENYVKGFQNRPTKKEREEMTQLKQELADAKELLKLKESKNGATQARLRTQIKQQEKDISELKFTVEKLQKENAKLTASQKFMRRPSEVKMLHEINKNLSKLTEETFKKQVNKSGSSDTEDSDKRDVPKERNKFDNCESNKENENLDTNHNNKEIVENSMKTKSTSKIEDARPDLTNCECLSVEKQYEQIFGKFSSPRNNSNLSANLEKTEKTLPDGSIEVSYSNGNLKTVSADGQILTIKYFNGDTKETNLREKTVKYHYALNDSWHIQYPDGSEVMEYKDGQKCKKHTDGRTEVTYPDGSLRFLNPDGTEEMQCPDGRKILKTLEGEQIILLPNGQREIHTKEYKRREYPDGTIRTLRKDGSVETVYSNGRVRIKDSNGVLVMDTYEPPST